MNLKAELEALLFATDQPLSIARLQEMVPRSDKEAIQTALDELENDYLDPARAFRLLRIAGGFQLGTKQEYADVVRRLFVGKRRVRLTKAALEALAIIAYKQPTTRPEIDAIRGVASGGVLETLLERNLVRIAGRAEGVGRPLLYATTGEFLQYLGLNRLRDLPNLEELEAMLVEREEEMRREEDEEMAALAMQRDADDGIEGAPSEMESELQATTTLEDKLRTRNLPTLEELDAELDDRRSAIERVVARVDTQRQNLPAEEDPAESPADGIETLSTPGDEEAVDDHSTTSEAPPAGR